MQVHRSTGEPRIHEVEVGCGTRLRSVCEACSDLYVGDAREVIRSGTTGGEALTFLTFTPPGAETFGRVHSGPVKARRRRCGCRAWHPAHEVRIGTPLDPKSYDYGAAARFNARAGRLFAVALQKLRRLTGLDLPYVRVVEFQKRGLVHFHALVRGAVSQEMLALAVRGGTNPRSGRHIAAARSGGFTFGPQCDARAVDDVRRASAYVRKLVAYATKAAGEDLPNGSAHARSMADAAAWSVPCSDNHPTHCDDCRCGEAWRPDRRRGSCRRHVAARRGWGFRGHVFAASGAWGTRFAVLRAARQEWAAGQSVRTGWVTVPRVPTGPAMRQRALADPPG